MRILTISGSLRASSSNGALLGAVALLAPPDIEIVPYDGIATLPYFNPDIDREGDVPPPAVVELRRAVGATDALVISSPEYAHGVPGVLKNALDWLVSGPEMLGRPVALLNASPGSTHAQASLAETLRTMAAVVVEEASVAVPLRGRGLDAAAIAADPALATVVRGAVEALARVVRGGAGAA